MPNKRSEDTGTETEDQAVGETEHFLEKQVKNTDK